MKPLGILAPPAVRTLARRGLAAAYRAGRRRGLFRAAANELTVLTFHRIATPAAFHGGVRDLVNADPAGFDRMLEFLAEWFTFVSADRVVAAFREGGALPADSLLLTFDDGYRDFLTHALPVLSAYEAPALIFPTTAGLETPCRLLWFDRIALAVETGLDVDWAAWLGGPVSSAARHARTQGIIEQLLEGPPERLRSVDETLGERLSAGERDLASRLYLDAGSLRRLPSTVAIGSHGRTHWLLSALEADDLSAEITASKAALEAATGRPVESFAYPVGRPQDTPIAAEEALFAAGYAMAFTMEPGRNVVGRAAPRYRLRRISAGHSLVELQCNLLRAGRAW